MTAWGPQPHQVGSLTLDRGGGNPPVNIVAPSLSISPNGFAGTGNVITLNPGVWVAKNPSIFTYTWLRSGVVIDGQSGPTYKISNDDIGSNISVEIRYADTGGLTIKRTAETATVVAQEPMFTAPMYTGTVLSNSNRTATVPMNGPNVYGGGYVNAAPVAGKKRAIAFRIDALADYPTLSIRRAAPDANYPVYNDSPAVTLSGSPQGWVAYQNGGQQPGVAAPSVGTVVTLTHDSSNGNVSCYYGSSLQFTYSMGSAGAGYPGFSAYRGFVTTLVLPYLPAGYEVWPSQ